MSKEIDINNEEQILKECDFDYYYECYACSRELCMFYNDIFKQPNEFNKRQAFIDLGRIGITINKQYREIADLEAKLAEKEKEIEELKASSDKNIDYLIEFASLIENEKDCNKMLKALGRVREGKKYIIDKEHQDKISFALEQLEKVKEFCDNPKYRVEYEYYTDCWTTAIDKDSLLNEIDNQIKQLKEMK